MSNTIPKKSFSLFSWLHHQLIGKRFQSVPGFIFITLLGILLAYLTSEVHLSAGIGVAGALIGIFLLLICLYQYEWGFYLIIIISTFLSLPERLFGLMLPVGLVVELMTYVVFLGILADQYKQRKDVSALWKHPISIMLLVNMGYYIIQAVNPQAGGIYGWSFFFRKQISFLAFYYIAYVVLSDFSKIKFTLKFWIFIAFFIALYGIKQHWFGFFGFEERWLHSDQERVNSYFQAGFMRKFSILSDPAIFAVTMSAMGLLTLVLGLRNHHPGRGRWLMFMGITMMFATGYSGTRTANLMIGGGIVSYIIFTLNETRTLKFAIVSGSFIAFLLFGPINSPVVYRLRSTLEGTKDPSQMVREMTRHRVQPYIYSHPLGGGINTCGVEGALYNPGHYLSRLQPDGGYMKIMVEQGSIGLLLHIIFFFIILKTGLDGYYQSRNHSIKSIYIALTIFLFAMYVGEISQITIGGYPFTLLFYTILIIFQKLNEYDQPEPAVSTL